MLSTYGSKLINFISNTNVFHVKVYFISYEVVWVISYAISTYSTLRIITF